MNGIGRLFGALATVVIMYISGQHTFGSGAVGLTVLSIAHTKVEFGFMQAIAGGASAQALRLTSETALHTLLTLLCAPAPCTATD